MNFGEVILIIIRWIHSIAAVTWIGGGIFYILVLRPVLGTPDGNQGNPYKELGSQFRNIVNTAIVILIVTGTVLVVSRLTQSSTGTSYIIVLTIKICLAMYMFYLVKFRKRNSHKVEESGAIHWATKLSRILTGAKMVTLLGVTIFLLADILSFLVEDALRN